jgi:hypothetical protein
MVKIVIKSVECIMYNGDSFVTYFVGKDDNELCANHIKKLWPDVIDCKINFNVTFTEIKHNCSHENWPEFFKVHNDDSFPNEFVNYAIDFISKLMNNCIKHIEPDSTQIPLVFNNN